MYYDTDKWRKKDTCRSLPEGGQVLADSLLEFSLLRRLHTRPGRVTSQLIALRHDDVISEVIGSLIFTPCTAHFAAAIGITEVHCPC